MKNHQTAFQRLRKGDVIEVSLPNGKKGFIQYFYPDKWGHIIGIYDYTTDWNTHIDLDEIINKEFKFYPILTRINQGRTLSDSFAYLDTLQKENLASKVFVKIASDYSHDYNWKIIGNRKIENFVYPNFIWKEGGTLAKNRITKWYLFNGIENIGIGKRIPQEYKNLEYQTSFPPSDIVELIMNGKLNARDSDRDMINREIGSKWNLLTRVKDIFKQ